MVVTFVEIFGVTLKSETFVFLAIRMLKVADCEMEIVLHKNFTPL